MTIAKRSDNILTDPVGHRPVNTLQIGASLEEIRIEQIRIQSILFHVLPVSPDFPAVSAHRGTTNQTETSAVSKSKSHLIGFDVVTLWSERRNGGAILGEIICIAGSRLFRAFPTVQ